MRRRPFRKQMGIRASALPADRAIWSRDRMPAPQQERRGWRPHPRTTAAIALRVRSVYSRSATRRSSTATRCGQRASTPVATESLAANAGSCAARRSRRIAMTTPMTNPINPPNDAPSSARQSRRSTLRRPIRSMRPWSLPVSPDRVICARPSVPAPSSAVPEAKPAPEPLPAPREARCARRRRAGAASPCRRCERLKKLPHRPCSASGTTGTGVRSRMRSMPGRNGVELAACR